MQPLPILWKRLVSEGKTCPRCAATETNVLSAVSKLEAALAPLGISPELETQTIDNATFQAGPSESNRIWIGGEPIEKWLGGQAGHSQCCEVCGVTPCRTMEVNGQVYEAIPERQIIKAAMIAASALVGDPPVQPGGCGSRCACSSQTADTQK